MDENRTPFEHSLKRARQAHSWDVTPREAIRLQEELRPQVVTQPLTLSTIRRVAGIDVGIPRGKSIARAAVTIFSYPAMQLIERSLAEQPITFPYVPGLLSFREIPVILAALEKLTTPPDILITDGHGLAHPRRFGLACHLGVLLDMPALGCAKSILVGTHPPLDDERGSTAPLYHDDSIIGTALRTRTRVKPVYISIGHRIDLATAVELTLRCGGGYRLPEPTRWAHRLASTKKLAQAG